MSKVSSFNVITVAPSISSSKYDAAEDFSPYTSFVSK